MADYRIGVIGIPGKWSTETLADAVEERTGYRLVIDMGEVSLDLEDRRLLFQDQDLCQLDALIVKKISATYSPNTLDRLELLRVAEQAGVRVFSRAESILRLIDRLSCTVTLRNAGIPMPATRVTEDVGAAVAAVQDFDAEKAAAGKKIHRRECEKCHSDGGSYADDDAGMLAGQWMPYLEQVFADYATGERGMLDEKMKEKIDPLQAESIEALIHYYASLQ